MVHIKSQINIILLDIEGTTTSINFVKETLFPYAKAEVENFLRKHWNDGELLEIIDMLHEQATQDETAGLAPPNILDSTMENDDEKVIRSLVNNIHWLIANDRKVTPLKALQGKIWRMGFEAQAFKGHVYEDVAPAFKKWTEHGKKIMIYSSGSIEAQKLLFGYSESGDLTKYLCGYFDTTTGPKMEHTSYQRICEKCEQNPEHILFITDVPKEAYAAQKAGLNVVLSIRPGNVPLQAVDKAEFPVIHSFDELQIPTNATQSE